MADKERQQPFALDSFDISFRPELFPTDIRLVKERNLDRSQSFCSGEDVSDQGSKNKEIHISGDVMNGQYENLIAIGDYDDTLDMVSATWSGEVRISKMEIDGPTGWYPPDDSLIWTYSLDVVSTGKDEGSSNPPNGGIISTPRTFPGP